MMQHPEAVAVVLPLVVVFAPVIVAAVGALLWPEPPSDPVRRYRAGGVL